MKNIEILHNPEGIHRSIYQKWRSSFFRESHEDKRGYVCNIVEILSQYPLFFYEASDPYLEKAHFSPWWGGIALRDYENGVIHDLYLLHEIVHLLVLPEQPLMEFLQFQKAMEIGEDIASTISELEVYFAIPKLRSESFDKPLLFDQLRDRDKLQLEWERSPEIVFRKLLTMRKKIETNDGYNSCAEKWIQSFPEVNARWFEIWRKRFQMVELARERLLLSAKKGAAKSGIRNHIDWLLSDSISESTEVPFIKEAREFAPHYWNLKNAG